MLEEVIKSLEASPIVKKGDYNYFVNPISDGVPAMDPLLLRELALAVHKYADLNIDKIVAVEAMGIHLATALSLATDTLIALIKTLEDMGLNLKSVVAIIDKGDGKEIVKKETGVDVLSIVKLDVIDGKVVIESTIED